MLTAPSKGNNRDKIGPFQVCYVDMSKICIVGTNCPVEPLPFPLLYMKCMHLVHMCVCTQTEVECTCSAIAVYTAATLQPMQCTCSLHYRYTETILPVHSTSVWVNRE